MDLNFDVASTIKEIRKAFEHNDMSYLSKLLDKIDEKALAHNTISIDPNFRSLPGQVFNITINGELHGPFCYQCFTETGKFVHTAVAHKGYVCQGGSHGYLYDMQTTVPFSI